MVVFLMFGILIGIFGVIAEAFLINDCTNFGDKVKALKYLIVGNLCIIACGVAIAVYVAKRTEPIPAPEVTAQTVCEQASVSPILCSTISEYTGEEEIAVAYYLTYCAKGGIDLDVAIRNMNLDLSDTEISAIITFSDKRQMEQATETTEEN